jgi:hypothetical protein
MKCTTCSYAGRRPAHSPLVPPRAIPTPRFVSYGSELRVSGVTSRHARCQAAHTGSSTSEANAARSETQLPQGFAPPKETGSIKKLAEKEQRMLCDKLIKAFQSKPQSEWRTLIAYSKQWPTLADKVFSRCCFTSLIAPCRFWLHTSKVQN